MHYIGTVYNNIDECAGSQEQTIIASKTSKYNKTINNLVVIIGLSLQ